ncbi:MAG: DUF885 domain-containing protein [Verrucomicrobiales bacterium]|nr:DUF885 domain-containing protein [Verrucomicrobiales bacterium]
MTSRFTGGPGSRGGTPHPRRPLAVLFLTWILAASGVIPTRGIAAEDPNVAALDATAAEFVRFFHAAQPLAGVALGWHEFDGNYVVPTAAQNAAFLEKLGDYRRRVDAIPANSLPLRARRDLSVLKNRIGMSLLFSDRMRWMERSPLAYADQPDVSVYLKRDWKPLAERVRDITRILRLAPAQFEAARANLKSGGLPKPWIELGIDVAEGTASFWEKDVSAEVATVADAALRAEFEAARNDALKAIRAFTAWLKEEQLPRAEPGFAIGREAFREMLASEMISESPEAILAIAEKELQAEQARFTAAAREIDPTMPAPAVFLAIQKDHPTEAGLLPDTRRNLEAIRDFVVSKSLVTIPSPVRAQVKETLPPFRATSFASMDTPGPFETKATEAYYYVTPTEPDWTEAQKQEWLTAFNYYTTDVVSIHEAYPGHYVQFLALNVSGTTEVAKVFGSYAFIEGWAHYTEKMVLDAGYAGPGPEDRRRAAKYRLAQSSEALLRIARLVCAVRMHCFGMTVGEATRFFVDNAHYQEKPARSEAMRGTMDPGYGFYTLGKLQLLKLREDWRLQEGDRFSLLRFHDEVLRHGMPPIRMLREILLKDPASWNGTL